LDSKKEETGSMGKILSLWRKLAAKNEGLRMGGGGFRGTERKDGEGGGSG
jgi:hypothetical protein